jgi:hypothetical protein
LGFRVFVTHRRVWEGGGPQLLTQKEAIEMKLNKVRNEPFFSKKSCPHIASTTVTVYDKETNEVLAEAVSLCGRKDKFNRKMGTAIALGRVLKSSKLQVSSSTNAV